MILLHNNMRCRNYVRHLNIKLLTIHRYEMWKKPDLKTCMRFYSRFKKTLMYFFGPYYTERELQYIDKPAVLVFSIGTNIIFFSYHQMVAPVHYLHIIEKKIICATFINKPTYCRAVTYTLPIMAFSI